MTELRLYDKKGKLTETVKGVAEGDSTLSDGRTRHDVRSGQTIRASVVHEAPAPPPADPPPTPPVKEKPTMDYSPEQIHPPGITPWEQWDRRMQDGSTNTSVCKIEIVPSPCLPGKLAYKTTVGPGGARAEKGVWSPEDLTTPGQSNYFADIWFFPSDPNEQLSWAVANNAIAQFGHEYPGASPGPHNFELRNGGGWEPGIHVVPHGEMIVPVDSKFYNRALQIMSRWKWSKGPDGELEIWVNPVLNADGTIKSAENHIPTIKGATLFTDHAGFQEGLYGPGRGNVVYDHGMQRGPSPASVLR